MPRRSIVSADKLLAYEMGELEEHEVVELFQGLVDTGLAWQLQGHYGRTAVQLMEMGLVSAVPPGETVH